MKVLRELEKMLGRLYSNAGMNSDCCDADVMVHLQGVGKLAGGMQHLPSGVMQVERVGGVRSGELSFAGFE